MEIELIVAHGALSIILFLIINWIGGHSLNSGYIQMSVLIKTDEAPAFNFLYRAFAPIVFITVFSAILYQINLSWIVKNIYLVVVYYFVFRLMFNLVTGRGRLLNWRVQVAYWFTSIPSSYYVYQSLILENEYLFPTPRELGSALWIAIIVFVYHTFNKVSLSSDSTKERKERYITHRYAYYKSLYDEIISDVSDTKRQQALIYSILLYEAFNRPKIYRLIERFLFYIGMASTLGVMQVNTDRMITDEESVRLGSKKIVDDHLKAQVILQEEKSEYGSQSYWAIKRKVISLYNKDDDYVSEVNRLYGVIVNLFYPELKNDWEHDVYVCTEVEAIDGVQADNVQKSTQLDAH